MTDLIISVVGSQIPRQNGAASLAENEAHEQHASNDDHDDQWQNNE